MDKAHAVFSLLDWSVLIGYFIGITAFGLWIARKVRGSGGYFLGDRQLPWYIMIGQAFGTGTHAEHPVAQTGATFAHGFATIWYQWKNMLITPFYWLICPWYRRSEKTTVGEIIQERYGPGLALFYTIFAIAFFVFNQGVMLKGAGKIISIATGGEIISPNGVVVAMTVTFILYSFFGGLIASAYTDFAQGFLIIVLSVMLIPLGLREVGGFSGMRASLPPDFFNLYSNVSGLDAFTIAMLTLNGLVGITAQPHMVSQAATGRNERSGRIGFTYGAITKRLCTIGWALTGLIVAAMAIQRGVTLPDKEAAFGYASRELLFPGLVGLMAACVLAANMSTCSNFMVNTGALFTRNIYHDYINPQATDRRLWRVGQLSGLGLTGLGIIFALTVDQVLDAFLFTETIAAFMGIMFLGGILWKRANRQGALAAVLSAFFVYYLLNYLLTCEPVGAVDSVALATVTKVGKSLTEAFQALGTAMADHRLWQFLGAGNIQLVYKWTAAPFGVSMLMGFMVLMVVSLLTRPEDPARIEGFFDNMRRSTDLEGLPNGQPKPLAADRGEELVLLDVQGWFTAKRWRGFWRRYREDVVGFIIAWGAVGLLILLAWGILQIGR